MAKTVQVYDGVSAWYTIPGNGGTFNAESAASNDTIFGQDYQSQFPAISTWSMGAQAFYKGVAGYKVRLRNKGTTTAFTDQAMSLVSGKLYRITDATKSAWDRTVALTVKDNGVAVSAANILSVDYLFGQVTFVAGYTVVGPITVTGSFFPLADLCKFNSLTLTMQANAVDQTDFCQAQANGGFRVYTPGLRTVSVAPSGFFDPVPAWKAKIGAGVEYLMEIMADGLINGSRARGFFQLMRDNQSGNVGELETEQLEFALSVPVGLNPVFSWQHGVGSSLPAAVLALINAYMSGVTTQCRYLEDGITGHLGSGVITDLSMSAALDGLTQFNFTLQGSGTYTVYP